MQPNLGVYLKAAWILVAVVWAAGAVWSKPATRTQFGTSRALQLGVLMLAVLLFFRPDLWFGGLDWRFVPPSSALAYIGLALTIAGVLFAIWARLLLGGNWSANVTIKQNHTLVQAGPYGLVRHPIYSGLLLAVLGTALYLGEARGLMALVLLLIGWRVKFRQEEAFMTEQFGPEYISYKRRVKALIPFVW